MKYCNLAKCTDPMGMEKNLGRKSFHHRRLFSTGIANLSISLMIVVNRWGNGYEAMDV